MGPTATAMVVMGVVVMVMEATTAAATAVMKAEEGPTAPAVGLKPLATRVVEAPLVGLGPLAARVV